MNTKPLTADQIAAALKREPAVAECHSLHLAIDARRDAIRVRLAEISPGPLRDGSADPAELREATSAQLLALKLERDELLVEREQLERLGFRVIDATERAHIAAAKRDIPQAMKRIPGKAQKVRAALAALDATIEELRADYAIVAEFQRIGACPFSDEQLAGLLELRDAVWTVRTISPPNDVSPTGSDSIDVGFGTNRIKRDGSDPRADWPRSWPLLYRSSGPTVSARRAPQPAEPPSPPVSTPEPTGTVQRVLDVAASVFK